MAFKDEADAYSYVINNVGLDCYVSTLLKVLASIDCETTLIGFSIGASAIWRLSPSHGTYHIEKAIFLWISNQKFHTSQS